MDGVEQYYYHVGAKRASIKCRRHDKILHPCNFRLHQLLHVDLFNCMDWSQTCGILLSAEETSLQGIPEDYKYDYSMVPKGKQIKV